MDPFRDGYDGGGRLSGRAIECLSAYLSLNTWLITITTCLSRRKLLFLSRKIFELGKSMDIKLFINSKWLIFVEFTRINSSVILKNTGLCQIIFNKEEINIFYFLHFHQRFFLEIRDIEIEILREHK